MKLGVVLGLVTLLIVFLGSPSGGEEVQGIGSWSLRVPDPARPSREVTAECFYPATLTGTNIPAAPGTFPVVVFAHGFQLSVGDYSQILKTLVGEGYIVAFLTTEQDALIDMDEYARDVIFVLAMVREAGRAGGTPLDGHVGTGAAFMGHSTGGGVVHIAQANSYAADTVVSLGALGIPTATIYGANPIIAAASVQVPALVIAGMEDCICPPEFHQKPLYETLGSATKAMIGIAGGDHCGFLDSSVCRGSEFFACWMSGQGPTIAETEQQDVSARFIIPWLRYVLRNDRSAWERFRELTLAPGDNEIDFVDCEPGASASLVRPQLEVKTGAGRADLSWSAVPDAAGYRLYFAPYPDAEWVRHLDLGDREGVNFELWSGAAFYVALKGYDGQTCSDISNIESFVVP